MGKKNIVWNDYISQNERFADFFNAVVFQGEELVTPEALTAMDTKLWRRNRKEDSYHEYVRDNVKRWDYGGMRYILGLEPEDSPHFALPVKYMNYESVQHERQYREIMKAHRQKNDLCQKEYLSGFSKSDYLMPVITIGIYLGKEKWFGHTALGGMMGMEKIPQQIKEKLLPLNNDFHVNLFDIHTMSSSDIFKTDLREVFGFLKRQDDKEALRKYVEQNERFRHLPEDAYDVLSVYSGSRELEIYKEEYEKEEEYDMCQAIHDMIEDGRIEGRAEGRAEGNILCLIDKTVKKYKRGMSVKDISDALEEEEGMIERILTAVTNAGTWEVEKIYACMKK